VDILEELAVFIKTVGQSSLSLLCANLESHTLLLLFTLHAFSWQLYWYFGSQTAVKIYQDEKSPVTQRQYIASFKISYQCATDIDSWMRNRQEERCQGLCPKIHTGFE